MKSYLLIIICSLLFLGGLAFYLKSGSVDAAVQNVVWEYKFDFGTSEKKANELGGQGWELVAIQSPAGVGLGSNVATYVFRRQKK